MLAGVRAFVFAHQFERLFGDGAHLLGAQILFHVEDRPHMQGPDRSVGVPGALGVVFVKNLGQAVGVIGQVLQANRAILDEGHRFTVALHRHHDVEALLADLPNRRLETGVGGFDNRVWITEIGHQGDQVAQFAQVFIGPRLSEFDQQQGCRVALHETVDRRLEHGDVAGQGDHRVIDQFDRHRAEFDQVLGGVHGLIESREMANAKGFIAGQGRQFQSHPFRIGQGAFRTDQQVR